MTNVKNKKNLIFAIIALVIAIVAIIIMISLYVGVEKESVDKENEIINEKFSFLVDEPSTNILNDDIFSGQVDIKDEYLKEYKKGNYTIDKPYVITNPYLISPQTALVLFKTKKSEKVTITLKGKHNDDLTTTFEATKDHFIPIYGLYSDYDNEIIIKTESGKTKTIHIYIENKLEETAVEVLENKLGNANGEFYFATSSLGVGVMAYDNYGEVRWWLDMGYTKGMTMLQNGHILLSSVNEGPDITSTSGVVEVDMLGFVHHEYEIEGGYHHDGYELKSGNLLILTSDVNSDTLADLIVEIDRNTGKVVKRWSLKDIVLAVDPNLIEVGQITWGWINSITYDENKNALILSVRNQNSVVSIDYDTGRLNWILGEKKYWTSKFDKYIITGEGTNFRYPAGQHSVNITSDGKLSIFNNGYNANHEEEVSCKSLMNNESYAMIYNLDLNNMRATVDWQFGGQKYFSYALSSFTYATNNHKVFTSGWHFTKDTEYANPECTQFSNDKYDSYLIEFDENNNIVLNMHIDESKFEVVKANIYNLSEVSVNPTKKDVIANYEVNVGSYLTTYEADSYVELSESEALNYASNNSLFFDFMMYNNRFKLNGAIPIDMDLYVTFISPSGKAYRYTMKEKNKEIKDFLILSNLPKGRYYVYVNMGSYVYNTTEYIVIR